jgi:hypothetical protein
MSYGWPERQGTDGGRNRGTLAVGLCLVLLGAFFLASEQFGVDLGRYGWPMFVIVPGVFLLLTGLAISHEGGLGAAIPGGIITTVGLILAFQDATGAYASWAYAWALVAPGSVGVSLALWGLLHRRWDLLDAGLRSAAVGLGLFIGFGLFFENVLNLDGGDSTSLARNALPLMAVGMGVLIVIWNLIPGGARSRASGNEWTPVEPVPPPTTPAPPPPPAQ